MENNKLIAEFMGYKLTKCNRGQAWERPTLSSIHDDYKLHGRLWVENDSYYKWGTSWDWLMPVVQECLTKGEDEHEWDAIYNAVGTIDMEDIYQAVVEFIKTFNEK